MGNFDLPVGPYHVRHALEMSCSGKQTFHSGYSLRCITFRSESILVLCFRHSLIVGVG